MYDNLLDWFSFCLPSSPTTTAKSKKDKRKKSTGFFSNLKRRLSRDSKSDETSAGAGAGAGAAVSGGSGMEGGLGLIEEVAEDVFLGEQSLCVCWSVLARDTNITKMAPLASDMDVVYDSWRTENSQ